MENLFQILLARTMLRRESDPVTQELFDVVLRLIEEWSQNEARDPAVDAVIHAITSSYSDPEFEVTKALLDTGYSKDHLRRRFREVTGKSPVQYLQDVRIRHAKQLLREKSRLHLSVNEIALMCGYYDPAYFCRSFQKLTGMTPSAFSRSPL